MAYRYQLWRNENAYNMKAENIENESWRNQCWHAIMVSSMVARILAGVCLAAA
jgi:hypothetical protein